MKHPVIGERVQHGHGPVALLLEKLLPSRLLIQGDSGSGKSYLLRCIAEQTHGKIQQIIIDTEDEFSSLREKFDYVLVGGENGDCPVSTREAPLLARRLLETNASAIINIYDMRAMPYKDKRREDGENRLDFVGAFLTALLEMPKSLWHPLLVIVDELQVYAPQDGKDVPSTMPIANFGAQARKRGFCPIYATPNIAGVAKNAIRGFQNYAIGSAALDNDNKRAGTYLGFDSDGREDLRSGMLPGEFYALGPGFGTRTPVKFKSRKVETTHPQPGKPAPPIPAPRAKLKKILSEFKGLAKETEVELKTVEALKAEIARLKGTKGENPWEEKYRVLDARLNTIVDERRELAIEVARLQKEIETMKAKRSSSVGGLTKRQEGTLRRLEKAMALAASELAKLVRKVRGACEIPDAEPDDNIDAEIRFKDKSWLPKNAPLPKLTPSLPITHVTDTRSIGGGVTVEKGRLPKGEDAVLRAVAQSGAGGATRSQITAITGYKRRTRDQYIVNLKSRGCVDPSRDTVSVTEEGIRALGNFKPLPTGAALLAHWYNELPKGEAIVLSKIVNAYPEEAPRDWITEQTGYKRRTRDQYIVNLKALRLVESSKVGIRASALLFDSNPALSRRS